MITRKVYWILNNLIESYGHMIKLKIGIHHGPVIAGVIGYHKP